MTAETVATPISAVDWAAELREIATRADVLGRNPDAPLADRLELAAAAFSRLWLAWSPAVVARSCRASSRLLEPVLVVGADLDEQLQTNQAIRMAALRSAGQLEQPAQIAPVLPGGVERSIPPRQGIQVHRPDGWLGTLELAAAADTTGARVRYLMRTGRIPAELVHRVSSRGLWFDPKVVELLRSGDVPAVHCAQTLSSP